MGLRVFWDGFGLLFGLLLAGLGMVLGCCCAWVWGVAGLFFDCFWVSRSAAAEKVEEPEPMRARARTTGRAVWVGLGVFGVGLLDCFCGAGLEWL